MGLARLAPHRLSGEGRSFPERLFSPLGMADNPDSPRTNSARGPTPSERMIELTLGSQLISAAIRSAVELDLPDRLGVGVRSVGELAKEADINAGRLLRMLRLLGAAGVVQEGPTGSFALTPVGATLRSGAQGSARDRVLYQLRPIRFRALDELTEALRTGTPAFEVAFGSPLFEYYRLHPEERRLFDAAMRENSEMFAEAFVRSFDFGDIRSWVDVGGGNGRMMAAVLKAQPQIQGIIFDLPNAIEQAKPLLAAEGVATRCRFEGGSFFERVPEGADVYFLRHIIHDWDDERSIEILTVVRRAMGPESRVLIADLVLPPGPIPLPAALMDLNMLAFPGGQERTKAEFSSLLERSGLKLERVVPTGTPTSLLQARRA